MATDTPDSPAASPGLSPALSPNRSRSSSRASHLTLDLSSIPPLTQPAVPTNTLLITNLNNPAIFAAPHITQLRTIIEERAPLASWSPLKSFRRIVCSFATTEAATAVRASLDGEAVLGDRVRVYFGEHTPLTQADQHLQAPESKKLFFISPPPSPPHGWESKNEDPPNAVVHAEDLAHALARLTWDPKHNYEVPEDDSKAAVEKQHIGRARSASSVLLFEPEAEDKEDMPAISVDDYTDSGDERSPVEANGRFDYTPEKATIHTQRPPVELMQDS